MPNLSELVAVAKETREILKGIVPSSAAGALTAYAIGCPALTISKFSLPSTCLWVGLVSAAVPVMGMFSSGPTLSAFKVTQNVSVLNNLNSGSEGPFNLSGFSVYTDAAQSGTTLTAWVQLAAPAAT